MDNLNQIKQTIQEADAILITAGAGMGVDSGLPDFRGDEGFWKAYPPLQKLGLNFPQMANPKWFDTNPFLAWGFYGHRLHLYRDTIPHIGFQLLLDLVSSKNNNYFIFTSNVDGQFQKAGFDEEKIYEVHGSIHHLQCSKNCSKDIWSAKDTNVPIDEKEFLAIDIPQCPKCNEIARPNILMFGDWDWNTKRSDNQEAKYNKWLKNNRTKKIAIIEIGAGGAIPTVRYQGEILSRRNPLATLIRINPREYNLGGGNGYSVPLGGLQGLNEILL
jgi:NAD-dependent SIR2 family protein deacetylase